MFSTFFNFELRFWLRGMMIYVFMFIIGLLIFAAVSSDNVQVGGSLENTHRNAPHVIQTFYSIMGLLTILMTTAFVNGAVSRDFAYNTNQLIFTKPLDKFGFLMGRFWGSAIVSIIPMLGVSIGIILARYMPWVEPEFWGPVSWQAHLRGILVFAIPNSIFVAAVIFAIAVWTRSTIASFVGALLLLVGYEVAGAFMSDLDNEKIGMLIDPFGIQTFNTLTKYWTLSDRNTLTIGLSGIMLWNRLLWLSISMLILGISYWRFDFTERMRRGRVKSSERTETAVVAMPQVNYHHGLRAQFAQLWSQIRIDFAGIIKSNVFIVVALAALIQIRPTSISLRVRGSG